MADVAVIGGTGFYSFLDDAESTPSRRRTATRRRRSRSARSRAARSRSCRGTARTTSTRRTPSTTAPTSGRCARSASARCWRRARSAGCSHDVAPGDVVVPDQLVDRTHRRVSVATSRPAPATCRSRTRTARGSATPSRRPTPDVTAGGTMVVIEGPRFSTRAESQHYAAQGWSLVNMTGSPEARARPRDAPVLRRDRAGHRHGRRARVGQRGSARRRCSRCSRPTSPGSAACSPT